MTYSRLTKKVDTRPNLQGQYAGFVSRLIALLLDVLIVSATVIILGISATLLLQFFGVLDLVNQLFQSSSWTGTLLRLLSVLGGFYAVSFFYTVSLWTFAGGQTLGKHVMGVRVVRLDGKRMILRRSILRYVSLWLAALPLLLGLLWVLVDDRRQGWHDKLARTCVIYDWQAREDEWFLVGLKQRLGLQPRPAPDADAGEPERLLPAGSVAHDDASTT